MNDSDLSLVPLEAEGRQSSKQCPKCGYERTPADDATTPPWKCPSCEIVYAKFALQGTDGPAPPSQGRRTSSASGRRASGASRGPALGPLVVGLGVLALIGLLLVWPRPDAPDLAAWTGDSHSDVRLFVTERCGYCRLARDYLDRNRVPYQAYDVERDAKARAAFAAFGGRGVPLILIGGERIDGWNQSLVTSLLEKRGLL